jgi:hypothetical protein
MSNANAVSGVGQSGYICPTHRIVHHPDWPCEEYEEARQVGRGNTTLEVKTDDEIGFDLHLSGWQGPARAAREVDEDYT